MARPPHAQCCFFGGKGGVGKTTCAAAFAVASARAGRRTLLISTDPAPSAGDALRQPLAAFPRPVKQTAGRLDALEVDAPRAIERWLAPRRATLETIAVRGTWLDEDDIESLLRLSLPGIDEVAALMEIGRLARSGRYELLVIDTAPTGHTLRMLGMPELLRTLAAVFDRMQDKHRTIVEALRGRWEPEQADRLIDSLDREGRELGELLRDPSRAVMRWVTLPEPMAVEETADALAQLQRLGIAVGTIVLNRMTPAPDTTCRWCTARRVFERDAVQKLLKHAAGPARQVTTVKTRLTEPRGATALAEIAAEMARPARLPRMMRTGRRVATATAIIDSRKRRRVSLPLEGISLLMFGGKGGVGKTTCAAAAALAAAAESPRRSVLLLSADPAHSVADVLGVPLSDEPRAIAGAPRNLRARELDAAARFEVLKARYADAIDALFERLVRGTVVNASADRQAMRDLMELAPPGIDELIAIVEVSDALETDGAAGGTLVVLDTAPTGHALRLLEMPAVVHDWVKALMSILLKYQPVVGLGELGAVLVQISQGLGRLRALLADPSRAAFIAVTRPAALPMAETLRLLKRLRELDVAVPDVIVNAAGAGTCRQCARSRRDQQRALAAIQSTAPGTRIVIAPAVMPPPYGPPALARWRESWTMER